ncbi:MAG TPA: hypothetical protein VN260_02430, partial [Dissulfurispiraceae bacterium]|nr:hypothetical protein [Dissulfurispiraceae bacterium]
ATLGRIRDETATAVLFLVEFDLLSEALSPKVAAEVVKTLGEFINKTFGALGGFSSRQRRGKLLTILPYVEPDEAKEMVRTLGPALQESLGKMQALTQMKLGLGACFEIHVSAGITEARSNEDIEDIIQRALSEQTVIARHRCEGKEVKAA